MATYTDNFNRADGALGANWSKGLDAGWTSWVIGTNQCLAGGTGDSAAVYSAGTFANNQYAQVVMVNNTSTGGLGLLVRSVASGGTGNGYALNVYCDNSGSAQIFRFDGGTPTSIANVAWSTTASDLIRLEANGTTIRALRNGVEMMSVVDATHASGLAGLYGKYGDATTYGDSWEGGDLGGGAAGPSIGAAYRIGVWAR